MKVYEYGTIKIIKRGDYLYCLDDGIKKASFSFKTEKMYGDTQYFKYFNEYLKDITNMTDEELFKIFVEYDKMINEVECFSVRDLIYHSKLIKELEKRNIEIKTKTTYSYEKWNQFKGTF